MPHYLSTVYLNAKEGQGQAYVDGLQQCINSLHPIGIFSGFNLFTSSKNLSFLSDEAFMRAFKANAEGQLEEALIWTYYVLCWAARNGLQRDGDFVECGTYKGTSSKIICDALGFAKQPRRFYLYDIFEHIEGSDHHALPDHGPALFDKVKARFAAYPNVAVIRGFVPQSFDQGVPERIAYLHIDMNSIDAEMAALDLLFDRVSPGGLIILDDYGWARHVAQKRAADAFLAARGFAACELPTGQGLVIR